MRSKYKVKCYRPTVFRSLRLLANIDDDQYMDSMCAQPLEEMLNPGASGASLYTSSDRRLIIKTVQSGEAKLLKTILKDYKRHLELHPQSFLPRFLGYYSFMPPGEDKIRLLVMKNLFAEEGGEWHSFEKFDLKGSRYGRFASAVELDKPQPTLKDLDFVSKHPGGIMLDYDTYEWLKTMIEEDCKALQKWDVMDYSLLLGIRVGESVSQSKNHLVGVVGTESGKKQAELSIGIIDVLQEFNFIKRVESTAKGLLRGMGDISVVEPKKYSKRFRAFLSDTVFHHCFSPRTPK